VGLVNYGSLVGFVDFYFFQKNPLFTTPDLFYYSRSHFYYSRPRFTTPDPLLLHQNPFYYTRSHFYFDRTPFTTPDLIFTSTEPLLLHQISYYFYRTPFTTPDPKILFLPHDTPCSYQINKKSISFIFSFRGNYKICRFFF
jgi:hypothetical protein